MFSIPNRRYTQAGIHGRVVHELGREIVTGVYKPGEKLPNEAVFINRFNGSRTAIREAFRVLAAKGLLEAKQRAGTSVRHKMNWNLWDPDVLSWHSSESVDLEMLDQIFDLRLLVEPEAVRLLSVHPENFVLAVRLEKICIQMEKYWEEGNYERLMDAELNFHLSVLENSGNAFYSRAGCATRISLECAQKRRMLRNEYKHGVTRWYGLVVEGIRAGDQIGAINAINSLITRDKDLFKHMYAKNLNNKSAAVA